MGEAMIRARGLRKSFGKAGSELKAVRGIDVEVTRGEAFGFLGPNVMGLVGMWVVRRRLDALLLT